MRLKKKWKKWIIVIVIILASKVNGITTTIVNTNAKEYVGKPNVVESQKYEEYRMTYYYTGDSTNSTNITASGLKTSQFKVNSRGWYTYKDMLVIATANKRLLSWEMYKNSDQKTYNLYDVLVLEIEGKEYKAIVADVCGACQISKKIDLFVKDRASGLDTQIKVILNNK